MTDFDPTCSWNVISPKKVFEGQLLWSSKSHLLLHCLHYFSFNYLFLYCNIYKQTKTKLTVGGDKFMVEPLLSWGPILECLLIGRPPPGVPPGEEAQDGAIRIFGVIRVLSDSLRLGNAFTTLRRLLSGDEGEPPNHHPPNIPPWKQFKKLFNFY